MVERLARCGQRSVTALVDISNYVMFEYGRPTHIFDLDKIHGGLDVRWGKPGEQLKLLNGNTVTLDESVGVIADDKEVESLAGIMGGDATAVSDDTRNVYVEAAFWWPEAVAGRSRRFNFATDAGHRFERGVDPMLTAAHIERISQLIIDICGTPQTACGPIDDQQPPVAGRLPREPLTQGQRLGNLGVRAERVSGDAVQAVLPHPVAHASRDPDGGAQPVEHRAADLLLLQFTLHRLHDGGPDPPEPHFARGSHARGNEVAREPRDGPYRDHAERAVQGDNRRRDLTWRTGIEAHDDEGRLDGGNADREPWVHPKDRQHDRGDVEHPDRDTQSGDEVRAEHRKGAQGYGPVDVRACLRRSGALIGQGGSAAYYAHRSVRLWSERTAGPERSSAVLGLAPQPQSIIPSRSHVLLTPHAASSVR